MGDGFGGTLGGWGAAQNYYNYAAQGLLAQQQHSLANAFGWTTGSATVAYEYPQQLAYGTPQIAPPKPENEAWLDSRIDEIRVKL